jgi:hypothetical protein
MAYFPNGTSGMMYQEKWCFRCKNYRDKGDGRGHGCVIWDAHLLWSYEECNNNGKTYTIDGATKTNPPLSNAKAMLDMLIPMDENHFPAECSMFVEMSQEEIEAHDVEFNRKAAEEAREITPAHLRLNTGPAVMPAMAEWAKARGLIA